MQLFDDAFTVLVLIVIGAGILVVHAKAHRVVEQDSDLACRRGDGFSVANARGEPSVECAERRIGSTYGYRRQTQVSGDAVRRFSRMGRQNLAATDLATRRKRQPKSDLPV